MSVKTFKTKKDIQNTLNVSMATVNNWIKTGIIVPAQDRRGFSEEEFNAIIASITSSESTKLKGRANRSRIDQKYICYLGISDESLKMKLNQAIEIYKQSNCSIEENILAMSITVLKNAGLLHPDWALNARTKIEQFLLSWINEMNSIPEKMMGLFAGLSVPVSDEDFIGAFYQSLQSVSSKSKLGSYYTPSILLKDIRIPIGNTVLDPCCGSGSILMKVLDKQHDADDVFAWDIDEIALKICRVNLCLFFNQPDAQPHIAKRDAIFTGEESQFFDFIITNPPWGSKFSKGEKEMLLQRNPLLKTTESFSIALFNAIQKLSHNGKLIFFLPHAFLNVSTHSQIRKYLLEMKATITIKLLGNAFKGVMAEAIRLEISRLMRSEEDIKIFTESYPSPTIIPRDSLQNPEYIISATANNMDFQLIKKVFDKPHLRLKNNAKFALGIVTGNNNKYLSVSSSAHTEPIFRGKDISPFCFNAPELYINFTPSIYQQVAPVELYRQTKIAYRFISDRLICALDREHRLLLNSANLIIPTLDYPLESIAVLFNSKLFTYLYRRMYHSKKVLRFHLESLPLPILAESDHQTLKSIHDRYMGEPNRADLLNRTVYALFDLEPEEIALIERDNMP